MNPLNQEVVDEPVPGNIRRVGHFIGFMKKVVEHLKARLRSVGAAGSSAAGGGWGSVVRNETPLAFLHRLTNGTSLEAKPLRFSYLRLESLLRTLDVSSSSRHSAEDYKTLLDVADFVSTLATNADGIAKFAIIMESNNNYHYINNGSGGSAKGPAIQLACLDASLAIAPLFQRFHSVVVTGGTLSPLDLYVSKMDHIIYYICKRLRTCRMYNPFHFLNILISVKSFSYTAAKAASVHTVRVRVARRIANSTMLATADNLARIGSIGHIHKIGGSGGYGSYTKFWRNAGGALQLHT